MSKCINEKCSNDPMKSIYVVVATIDGDFACCQKCLNEYKKQRDNFFDNIDNNKFFKNWLNENI